MSTKMGFWRWALASAAILIATGTAGARVIDPTGVTTEEPAAIVLYPKLKVDLNTCQGGFCSLTPDVACTDSADCSGCNGSTCQPRRRRSRARRLRVPGRGRRHDRAADQHLGVPDQGDCFYTNTNSHCSNAPRRSARTRTSATSCPRGGLCVPGWVETDFRLTLTKRQPISWSVNDGLSALPLASDRRARARRRSSTTATFRPRPKSRSPASCSASRSTSPPSCRATATTTRARRPIDQDDPRRDRREQVQRDRHQGDRGPPGRQSERAQHRRSGCRVRRVQRDGRSAALRRLPERPHPEPLLRRRQRGHARRRGAGRGELGADHRPLPARLPDADRQRPGRPRSSS